MNDKNRNPWDGRRPSLDRWWETPENENDEMPEKITSPPNAVENTKQWIDRSSQQPNENTGGKNRKVSIAKKPDCTEICKVKPCLCMKLKLVIKTNTDRLTDDVCSLYDRWLCGPLATDLEFHNELLTLISVLKKIIQDLNSTTGNHGELESLIKRHSECQGKYQTLLKQLDQPSMPSQLKERCECTPKDGK
ncbi:unnamed protein product [Macrosiphum euphorbiae]|uniref:Uncharacterized protein n=1 Tax=Macrosiphum euphorbiae TaxID=13131 RepID=A0AAV0X3Y8_9HEMI|nr:unnamed protein product [Macrosiphum euphorbiae]